MGKTSRSPNLPSQTSPQRRNRSRPKRATAFLIAFPRSPIWPTRKCAMVSALNPRLAR